jgi:hypothetical protein
MARGIVDLKTGASITCDVDHHLIHDSESYTAYYTVTTAATDDHRSGLYIKTPAAINNVYYHAVISFGSSAAAEYFILEAPTIAANIGTHGLFARNRDRSSSETSGVRDNATSPGVGKYTTLTEAQIAGDGTWATGTVLRNAIMQSGVGPVVAGGSSRGAQEYILAAGTAYVFMIQNIGANANTHIIQVDWYEHIPRPRL